MQTRMAAPEPDLVIDFLEQSLGFVVIVTYRVDSQFFLFGQAFYNQVSFIGSRTAEKHRSVAEVVGVMIIAVTTMEMSRKDSGHLMFFHHRPEGVGVGGAKVLPTVRLMGNEDIHLAPGAGERHLAVDKIQGWGNVKSFLIKVRHPRFKFSCIDRRIIGLYNVQIIMPL